MCVQRQNLALLPTTAVPKDGFRVRIPCGLRTVTCRSVADFVSIERNVAEARPAQSAEGMCRAILPLERLKFGYEREQPEALCSAFNVVRIRDPVPQLTLLFPPTNNTSGAAAMRSAMEPSFRANDQPRQHAS